MPELQGGFDIWINEFVQPIFFHLTILQGARKCSAYDKVFKTLFIAEKAECVGLISS